MVSVIEHFPVILTHKSHYNDSRKYKYGVIDSFFYRAFWIRKFDHFDASGSVSPRNHTRPSRVVSVSVELWDWKVTDSGAPCGATVQVVYIRTRLSAEQLCG